MRDYPVIIEPISTADGGGFLATVPDLPGCKSDGGTRELAARNIEDAIASWIEEAQAVGRKIPGPKPISVSAVSDRPGIDHKTRHAARVFLRRLEGKYAVIEALLFGSRARGDHKPDSDADIAVILEGERGELYEVAGDMAEIAFDVLLETDVLVQAMPLWEGEFKNPGRFNNPALIANIKREGIRL